MTLSCESAVGLPVVCDVTPCILSKQRFYKCVY